MNVRELIEHLSQFDPETPVKVRSRINSPCIPMDVFPPFLRVMDTLGRNKHVLIEEVVTGRLAYNDPRTQTVPR